MPNENCIYFGDTKNIPYGEKTNEQLSEFSKKAFDFFESMHTKAVVLACNTTSAAVYDIFKDKYNFKLYPLIQSVTKIFSRLPAKRIGILATPATINSHAYSLGIKKYAPDKEIIEIACPEWVRIVENREEKTPAALNKIRMKLDEMMKFLPEKIVLGCTHYPFLMKQLTAFTDENLFIDPAKYYVEFIKSDLEKNTMIADNKIKGSEIFYVSNDTAKFRAAGSTFYDLSLSTIIKSS